MMSGNILKEMFSIYIMTEFLKCNRCSSKELKYEDFGINTNGERMKSCNSCRVSEKQRKDNNREAIREQSKEHYQVVKESKIEKAKQWKLANHDKLHEIQLCECGGQYEYRNIYKHEDT